MTVAGLLEMHIGFFLVIVPHLRISIYQYPLPKPQLGSPAYARTAVKLNLVTSNCNYIDFASMDGFTQHICLSTIPFVEYALPNSILVHDYLSILCTKARNIDVSADYKSAVKPSHIAKHSNLTLSRLRTI